MGIGGVVHKNPTKISAYIEMTAIFYIINFNKSTNILIYYYYCYSIFIEIIIIIICNEKKHLLPHHPIIIFKLNLSSNTNRFCDHGDIGML